MGAGVLLTIGSLFYIIVLGIVYFKKIKINSLENRIFKRIIISNILGLVLHLLLFCLMIYVGTENVITIIVSKLYLVYLVTYMILFTDYVFIISSKNKEVIESNFNKLMFISFVVIFFTSLCIFYLPIEFHNEIGKMYSYGLSVYLVYIIGFLMIILNVCFLLKNIKQALKKQYYPLFLYFLLGLVTTIIQFNYPYIQLITAKDSFIIFLMYFTIENPDIKMAKELAFSKKKIEEYKDKTLEILDNISKKLKTPLDKMQTFSYKKVNKDDITEVNKQLKYIQNYCSCFVDDVNGFIEVGKLESGSLKNKNHEYETFNLFQDIEKIFEYENSNKNISVSFSLDNNIPNTLYGDNLLIKQMMLYVYDYLVEIIKKGNINVRVDAISVGNFCKLKFYISVNCSKNVKDYIPEDIKLFDYDEDTDSIKYVKMRKIATLINADIDVIDKFNLLITIKQRIVDPYVKLEKEGINLKIKVKYFDASNKSILILDDNNSKIKELVLLLRPYNVNVDISKSFNELKEKLSSNRTYDLVLIDDVVDSNVDYNENEYNIKLLKRFTGYEFKGIIMLSKSKEENKKEYLDNGFDDYIIKPINKKNINELMSKYLKN